MNDGTQKRLGQGGGRVLVLVLALVVVLVLTMMAIATRTPLEVDLHPGGFDVKVNTSPKVEHGLRPTSPP
jgi:hypothetical protein